MARGKAAKRMIAIRLTSRLLYRLSPASETTACLGTPDPVGMNVYAPASCAPGTSSLRCGRLFGHGLPAHWWAQYGGDPLGFPLSGDMGIEPDLVGFLRAVV